jgi:hypothetical protein
LSSEEIKRDSEPQEPEAQGSHGDPASLEQPGEDPGTVEEPAIADQSMRDMASWAEKLSEEVIAKMRLEMKKRGHEI